MQSNPSADYSQALKGQKIAVIGAGIGGACAALALARRGAQVVIYEQAITLGEVGAGLQISPNGVAVLAALGVKPAAKLLASTPEFAELRDPNAGLVARLPLGATAEQRYGEPYWQFHRADLLTCLSDAAYAAGVTFKLGHRAEGAADGTLHCGSEATKFSAIIAADGVHSAHRVAQFGGASPQFLNHIAWRALVPTDGLPADALAAAARVYMGRGRHLVTYPLRGGALMNLVGVVEWNEWVGDSWSQASDGVAFGAAFQNFGGTVPALLERVSNCYRWGLFGHAPLARWVNGKLALLGDACHPTLPFLAQGATQALEDGWALAACLANSSHDISVGLNSYQSARKARADAVVRAAARSGRLYHVKPPVVQGIRNIGLRGVAALAPSQMLRRFDWIYGEKPFGL